MEDYPDPYQCVLEIRGGKSGGRIRQILTPLLVGIDPAFELVSFSAHQNFNREYESCGKVSNDNHFHELDEGEYIESPALAILLFLDENSPSLTPESAKQCLLTDAWEFHHKIELSKLKNGAPKTIAKQEYYTLGSSLPLWSVGSIHYGNEHLRFNLFARRFAAMVDFYRVLTGKEGECTRSGFCMFSIYSQPGLDIQLALKRSERIIPVAIKSAALRFKIQNVKELKSIATSKIVHMGNNTYSTLDPDGNLVILEEASSKSSSPGFRVASEDRVFEDNKSIADSYDSGRYSNSSDHGETESSTFGKTSISSSRRILFPEKDMSENIEKLRVDVTKATPPKPAPRQKAPNNSVSEQPKAKPTPTKRRTVLKSTEKTPEINGVDIVYDNPVVKESRYLVTPSNESPRQNNSESAKNDPTSQNSSPEQGELDEPKLTVRDRAKAINRLSAQYSGGRVQTTPSDKDESHHMHHSVVVLPASGHERREAARTSPRQSETVKTDKHMSNRSKSVSGITMMELSPVNDTNGDIQNLSLEDHDGYIEHKARARARTASSGAVLSGEYLGYRRGLERPATNEQRIPTETMNKLLKTLPARLESPNGKKPYLRLDQRIRRALNNTSYNNSDGLNDGAMVGARF